MTEQHTPPEGVRAACRQGIKLKAEHGGPGLTAGAIARARSMAAGSAITAEQAKRMRAFFARHQVDKKAGWSQPPTPGYVAWQLWGGDAGRAWANKVAGSAEDVEKAAKQPAWKRKGWVGPGGAWETAKRRAKEQGKDESYASSIYAKMTGHKSLSDERNDMQKAQGEGSRGGHIIGHTKSGKPIYQLNTLRHGQNSTEELRANHPVIASLHPDFTREDHKDAAWHHFKAADEARHDSDRKMLHVAHENAHNYASNLNSKGQFDPPDHGHSFDNKWYKSSNPFGDLHMRKLSKAGEGSRGGHIIGHTKSGKPIYQLNTLRHGQNSTEELRANHPVIASLHPDFTREDHKDAAWHHFKAADEARHDSDSSKRMLHVAHENAHRYASNLNSKGQFDPPDHGHSFDNKWYKSLDAFGDLHAVLRKAKSGGLEILADDESLDADYIYDPTANGDLEGVAKPPQGDPRTEGDSGGETIDESDLGEMAPKTRVAPNAGDAKTSGDSRESSFGEGTPVLPTMATDDWHSGQKVVGWTPGGLAKSAGGSSYSPQELACEQAHELALKRAGGQQRVPDVALGLGVPGAPPERQEMAKAQVVQRGMVTHVYGGVDERAAAIAAGGDFWSHGRSPTLDARGYGPSQTLCKSCQGAHPAYLTACPACGVGSTLQKGGLSADSCQGVSQPVPSGQLLRPVHVQDLYMPGLSVGPR